MSDVLISADRVEAIYNECLSVGTRERDQEGDVMVEGIIHSQVSFNKERLEANREEVEEMLKNLPYEFRAEDGGGWSFLNACEDRNGLQWTGFHQRMDQLFSLGLGLGRVICQVPREMWSILPGGMPYYAVTFADKPEDARHA